MPPDDHPKALLRGAGEISAGDRHRFEVQVDEALIRSFAAVSGDFNPLHTDPVYARSAGFRNAVAHGALQIAWVSQSVGMWLIGVRCLVRKISSSFPAPLVVPCRAAVESKIESWSPKHETGRVAVAVKNAQTGEIFSEHAVEVGVHPEPGRTASAAALPFASNAAAPAGHRPRILMTGATGGMLRHLAIRLAGSYEIVLAGRDEATLRAVAADAGSPPGLSCAVIDLVKETDGLEDRLNRAVPEGTFWGVVHGASLPIFQQSILDADAHRLAEEWTMTATVPIRLGRWLRSRAETHGGRLLMIGSESSKLLPQLHSLPKAHLYGLGKRFLRETAHVLAQELAPKKITVNTLHPGPIPQGMNAGMSPSSIRMLEAENPMKRLCGEDDLAAAALFFLSESSGYVSGQDLVLNGGRF